MSKLIEFLEIHKDQLDKKIVELLDNKATLLATGLKESGLDSLQYFELIMQIEEHFDIDLSEQATAKASTFQDIDDLIKLAPQGCDKKSN